MWLILMCACTTGRVTPSARLSWRGFIQSANDSAIVQNATIQLDRGLPGYRQLSSSATGVFIIDSLAPGRHTMRVLALGYVPLDTFVLLSDSSVARFVVRMQQREPTIMPSSAAQDRLANYALNLTSRLAAARLVQLDHLIPVSAAAMTPARRLTLIR